MLVFDSEAGGEDGKPNSRAGFTEKTDKLGNDSESQETVLREIVNGFLDVGDAPDGSSAMLARWISGMKKLSPPPSPVALRRLDRSRAPRLFAQPRTKSHRLRRRT